MKPAKRKSLKRRLTIQLLLFQIGSLFIVTAAIITYMSSGGAGSALLSPEAAQITANAIVRDKDNRLVLRETPEFIDLRNGTSDFWFVAVSEKGEIVQGGQVPEAFSNMDQQLSDVRISDVRDAALSYSYLAVVRIAVVRRASGPAGEFVMIGKGGPFSMTFPVLLFSNILIMPVLILMSIVTIVAIPWLIRREFRALSAIARTAETIDIDRRGYRLPDGDIPREVQPLVHAVNGALKRLDDGYERHKRFILDAAHELRTPSPFSRPALKRCWTARPETEFWRMPAALPCWPNNCWIYNVSAGRRHLWCRLILSAFAGRSSPIWLRSPYHRDMRSPLSRRKSRSSPLPTTPRCSAP